MREVIYARVSTNIQDYQRQLYELREYAARMEYEVVKEFSEKVSGAKKNRGTESHVRPIGLRGKQRSG